MACQCFIIPPDVLDRLSKNKKLPQLARKAFKDAFDFEIHWRKLRSLQSKTTAVALQSLSTAAPLKATTAITVYDCAGGTALPGSPAMRPTSSSDATTKRAFDETTAVADFYRRVFGRNSLDKHGMTLQSSVHYGVNYNNAFWNGVQMTYGDGDGSIFTDFTLSNDVIGHELAHGVTQHSARLNYTNEAGGLNESISDVFGSMFRQWRAGQTAAKADWLIGRDIMGPAATAQGFTCLRDLAKPAAKHCLAPQPKHFSELTTGMDPHYSSGVPNLAFYKAAKKIGGKSWETVGQIWYRALTGYASSPNLKMKTFANRTRKLAKSMFPDKAAVYAAVDKAWIDVGL
jgi:Zn-dependent metalloprotease